MTDQELRALILKDTYAGSLAALAGEALTISARVEALTTADPLTTFRNLLRERTRRVAVPLPCLHCKLEARAQFTKQELEAALTSGALVWYHMACDRTSTLMLDSEKISNIKDVLARAFSEKVTDDGPD